MSEPRINYSTAISAAGAYCAISSHNFSPLGLTPNVQVKVPLITQASFTYQTASGVSAGTVVIQELGADGVWRTLTTPASQTLAASTTYTGAISGQFHGLQLVVAGLTGGNILYAELKGVVSVNPL